MAGKSAGMANVWISESWGLKKMTSTFDQPLVVRCEAPETIQDEVDFLTAITDAENAGEITPVEASQMIDRQYELWSQAK